MSLDFFCWKIRNQYIKIRDIWHWYLNKLARFSVFLPCITSLLKLGDFRAFLWKCCGCKIGKGVFIGWDVYFDVNNAELINVEDDVRIASRALILCHRRNISYYFRGEKYKDLPYIRSSVTIKKGAAIGMGAILMPGVTIGEGAVVGAGALVTKDVPAWTVVAGSPARVIKVLEYK